MEHCGKLRDGPDDKSGFDNIVDRDGRAQLVLFVIHPRLDAMLDAQTHSIIVPTAFHPLHEFYLTIVSVQWFAGLAHFVTLISSC